MPKASEMLSKAKPTAKDLVGENVPPATTVKLRNEYQVEAIEAQTSGGSVPPWEEWLKEKGYGLVSGQAVRMR